MARKRLLAVLSIGIGLLAPLVLLEVVLRLLPVASGLQSQAVNERNPVMRFTPHRQFTFSKGWDFKLVNRGRTNNYGFVNDQDYDSTAHTPLLAVVGDSYVEASMVPFPETLQGRLSTCVGGAGRVYSFGVAGAPLSQYLAEASFARSRFRPDGLVVVIAGNDFDESLLRYKNAGGFHYFRPDSNGLVLDRVDYSPNWTRRLVRKSALVRYITLNLSGGARVLANLKRLFQGHRRVVPHHVGNTEASFTPERLKESQQAVDALLTDLPLYSGVNPGHIVLVVDGIRPELYTEEGLETARGSFFDLMRRYLLDHAERRGYEVTDMQRRFIQRHAVDGVRFEFPSDAHWNSRGHQEAATAVASSKVFRRIFPAGCVNLPGEGQRASRP